MAYYEEHVRSPTVLLNARSEFEARMAKQKTQHENAAAAACGGGAGGAGGAGGPPSAHANATAAQPFNLTLAKPQPAGGENARSGEGEACVRGVLFAKHLRSPGALTRESTKFAKRMEKNKGATSTDAQPFKFAEHKHKGLNKAPSFSDMLLGGLSVFNGKGRRERRANVPWSCGFAPPGQHLNRRALPSRQPSYQNTDLRHNMDTIFSPFFSLRACVRALIQARRRRPGTAGPAETGTT
jgi:hypothetical protein